MTAKLGRANGIGRALAVGGGATALLVLAVSLPLHPFRLNAPRPGVGSELRYACPVDGTNAANREDVTGVESVYRPDALRLEAVGGALFRLAELRSGDGAAGNATYDGWGMTYHDTRKVP